MHVFETRTTTGRGHFACQDSGVFQTFIPSISNGEKILVNANAVALQPNLVQTRSTKNSLSRDQNHLRFTARRRSES